MFYNESGKPLSPQEFVAHYEPYYYIGSASRIPKNKTSRFVEEKIDEIFLRGVTAEDIPLIIAWKVGIINHAASINSVVYTGDFARTSVDIPDWIPDFLFESAQNAHWGRKRCSFPLGFLL